MNTKNSVIVSLKFATATAAARKKIRRRRDWSVDDFDAMEIRRRRGLINSNLGPI